MSPTPSLPPEEAAPEHTFMPKTDIWETANAFQLEVELPGVTRDGLDIRFAKGQLTILGRVDRFSFPAFQPSRIEYRIGNFSRSFTIEAEIREQDIDAVLENGLLTVHLPKVQAKPPQSISVRCAGKEDNR